MAEKYHIYRQAADLIGNSFRNPEVFLASERRAKILTVLPDQPTEDEIAQFEAMRTGHLIYLNEYKNVMVRVNPNISVGVNLRSGYYELGQGRLTGSNLYLARQLAGWEDPTGVALYQSETGHPKT